MTTVDVELSLVKRFRTMCERFDSRPLMARRNTLPTLIRFLGSKEREIRRLALESINLLAQHPDNLHLLNTATGLNDGVFTLFREAEYDDPVLYELANDTLGLLASTDAEHSDIESNNNDEMKSNDSKSVTNSLSNNRSSSNTTKDSNNSFSNSNDVNYNHHDDDNGGDGCIYSDRNLKHDNNNEEISDNHSNMLSQLEKSAVNSKHESNNLLINKCKKSDSKDNHDDEGKLLLELRKSSLELHGEVATSNVKCGENYLKKINIALDDESVNTEEKHITDVIGNRLSNNKIENNANDKNTNNNTHSHKRQSFSKKKKNNKNCNNDSSTAHLNVSPIKKQSESRERSYSTECEVKSIINFNKERQHAKPDSYSCNDDYDNDNNNNNNISKNKNTSLLISVEGDNIDNSKNNQNREEESKELVHEQGENSISTTDESNKNNRASSMLKKIYEPDKNNSTVKLEQNALNKSEKLNDKKESKLSRLPIRTKEHRSATRAPCVLTLLIPSLDTRVSSVVSAKIENVLLSIRGVVSYTLLPGAHQTRIFLSDRLEESVQAALRQAGVDSKIVEVESLPVFGARDGSLERLSDASYADNVSFTTRRSKFSFQSCKGQNEKSFFDNEQRKPTYVEQAKTFASSMYSALTLYRTPQARTLAERIKRQRKVEAGNSHNATAERVIKAFTNWWEIY